MDTTHFCHARYCGTPVRPDLFMCYGHWVLVPADIRRLVWRHYRSDDKTPSVEYQEVIKKAQDAVEKKEFESCLQSHGSECGCWMRFKYVEVAQGQCL